MIVLQAKDVSKSFGAENIFKNVSFTIASGEKVGLVGPNGAGKTTLFRCLTGEEETDLGAVMLSNKLAMGYLEQLPDYSSDTTLFDAVMEIFADIFVMRDKLRSLEKKMGEVAGANLERVMEQYGELTEEYERAGGFSCESMARRVLAGLSFTDKDFVRNIASFSGGEKTRASLARLLVREPDLLLLDEPTNHLDLQAVEWLEGYLKDYKGSVFLISHDRYFLDSVTNKTLELEHGSLEQYPGSYSRYLQLKAERELARLRAYEKQQKEIKETEEYINKYRAGIKSKQARGRQSILNRLERIEASKTTDKISLQSGPVRESGNIVLAVEDLTFGYDKRILLNNVDLTIYKGEKVALIGANGTGKSSLLKLIVGSIADAQDKINIGARVQLGYFDQEHAGLNRENRVVDEIVYTFGISEGEARNYLAAVLFKEDDVYKKIADLSGGERGRLSFLKLIIAEPNFLILDEPTNHLDIASKEIIEGYLQEFEGTILMVSHDRYFMDKVANRTIELENASLVNFLGNYSYYKEKKAQLLQLEENIKAEEKRIIKDKNEEVRPKINKAKTRERIACLEKDIENMEQRFAELSELLADAASYKDEETAKALVDEYKMLEDKIPKVYEEWEQLNELLLG